MQRLWAPIATLAFLACHAGVATRAQLAAPHPRLTFVPESPAFADAARGYEEL